MHGIKTCSQAALNNTNMEFHGNKATLNISLTPLLNYTVFFVHTPDLWNNDNQIQCIWVFSH